MAERSPIAVSIADGDIFIDAEALAPKLGLSVDALKEEMGRGLVTSIAETGVDDDEGRLRLTFRYRARAWRVVMEPDGTLVEDPLPTAKPPPAKPRFSLVDLTREEP